MTGQNAVEFYPFGAAERGGLVAGVVDEDRDPGTVTDPGSGGGGGSGSKEKADKGTSVPDEEKETEYEEESYYEDEGFVEFAATVPLKNERIIIEVKGNRATVSFTGEEQEEEGFTYEARGEKTKVDVSDEVILELAEKYNKSSAQIILRWQLQAGFIAIPGSSNPDHIAENYDIFDFELTVEEMQKISTLDRQERYENW